MRKPLSVAKAVNEMWSMDFMSDSLIDGRTLRVLNIIDEYNRESLAIEGAINIPSQRVICVLDNLVEQYGKPSHI